jgi:hypothetical protein
MNWGMVDDGLTLRSAVLHTAHCSVIVLWAVADANAQRMEVAADEALPQLGLLDP